MTTGSLEWFFSHYAEHVDAHEIVCKTCGALVSSDYEVTHVEWHGRLGA